MVQRLTAVILFCLVFLFLPGFTAASNGEYQGWKQIKTEHIQIIFEPQDEAYAREITTYADDVVLEISSLLDYLPDERIPVVLLGRTAWANGYYSPFPHSITLFVRSPTNRFHGARTSDWLYTLFLHEVTHYIHLTAREGPARFLAPVFGPDITAMNTVYMPGWWIEGITTYTETEYADGGRGESPLFELTYKAPIIEDELWSLWQSGYQSAFPPSGRIYTSGYIFVNYLIDRFGPDIFHRINSRLLRFPFFGLSFAIRQETGVPARELYEEMKAQLRQEYSEMQGLPFPGNRYSPEAVGDYYLPFPTERGWIGWARDLDNRGAVVQYDAPGEKPEVLIRASISDPASFDVTPDGSAAVVASFDVDRSHRGSLPNDPVSYSQIYRLDLIEGKSERLTERTRLYQPAISPGGDRIVAIEAVGTRYRLVEIDRQTGKTALLYQNPEGSVYGPRFSSDGNHLIAIETVKGNSTLVYFPEIGRDPQPLWPHSSEEIWNPRFTPDNAILFASDRSGPLALYRINPETHETHQLLTDPLGVIGADVHADQMLYSTYTSSGFSIRQIDTAFLSPKRADKPQEARLISRNSSNDLSFESRPYRDFPRLGIWLPLPYLDGSAAFNPGLWGMLQSILGKHSIQASAGWNINEAIPLADIQYQFNPGWGTFLLEGRLNSLHTPENLRFHQIAGSLSLPLWNQEGLDTSELIFTSLHLDYRDYQDEAYSSVIYAVGQGGYQWVRSAPRAAFFGTKRLSLSGGLQAVLPLQTAKTMDIYPFVNTTFQVPLPLAHHVLRLDLDGLSAVDATFSGDAVLLPRGNPGWGREENVQGKLRGTLFYRLPLGLFDLPVPFGGITAAGCTLFAQSAIYAGAEQPWEQDIYAGAEASLDISIRGLATLRPTAGVTFSLIEGGHTFYFDIGISSLFVGGQDRNTGPGRMPRSPGPLGSF